MGIYTVNTSIKPTFTLAIMKKNCNLFLSFVLHLNIFVNFKTIQFNNLSFYTLLSSANFLQIHQIALTIDMCQGNGWEALSLQLLFCIF